MRTSLAMGLDVGSTTVKAVVMDGERIVFSDLEEVMAAPPGQLPLEP